jgi:hypothetical protein
MPCSVVYLYINHWLMHVLQIICQVIWPHNKYFTFVEPRCSLLCLQTGLYSTDVYSPCPYIILLLLRAFLYNIYSKQSHSLKFCNKKLLFIYFSFSHVCYTSCPSYPWFYLYLSRNMTLIIPW